MPLEGSIAWVSELSQVAAEKELRDVHATERLIPYLREVWTRRPYVWYVSASELRARQVTTVLGNLWHLLNPALTVAVYYLIFGLLLKTDRGVDNFILFLSAGLFAFQSSQRAITAGASSVVAYLGLIKAIKFPRAILPATTTLTETLSTASTFVVILAVALATGQLPTWHWFVLIPIFLLQAIFNFGASMMMARLTTHFRDTTQILPFVFRLLLYGSGVIFNLSAYTEGHRTVELIFMLNPFYGFVTMTRWAIMGDPNASLGMVIATATTSILCLVVGFLWFRAGEEGYARD